MTKTKKSQLLKDFRLVYINEVDINKRVLKRVYLFVEIYEDHFIGVYEKLRLDGENFKNRVQAIRERENKRFTEENLQSATYSFRYFKNCLFLSEEEPGAFLFYEVKRVKTTTP